MSETVVVLGAWEQYANCLGVDPALFFPDRGTSPDAALEVCAGCGVRAECLEHALARVEQHGIWGGMTAKDRRRLRAQRLAANVVPLRRGSRNLVSVG